MSRREILCEGPEDLAALREVAGRCFGATPLPADRQAGGAGADRRVDLCVAGVHVLRLTAVRNAKSALPHAAATQLATLPPIEGDRTSSRLTALGVLFDPDGDAERVFHAEMNGAFAKEAKDWSFQTLEVGARGGAAWIARRAAGERVLVRALAWRADGEVLDGLRDEQNMERVMCRILADAYPADVELVAGWLAEITRRRRAVPRWKAAVHLWSALVDEKATEHTAPARFFGQHDACRPCVQPVLDRVGLLREIARFAR